ncbi:hypothetical protein ACSBR2_024294 [Camellia fascicularis]
MNKEIVEEVKRQLWLAGPLIRVSLLQFILQWDLSGASMANSFTAVPGFSLLFLQAQNIVFPMMISSGITTLNHLLMCWILVFKSGLGTRGAALANSISNWINVQLLALDIMFSPCAKSWTGFSKEALHNIPTFIKLAITSAVMIC